MTCIIALKKDDSIYWGADSCVTGYDTRTMSRPKIFQVGAMVIGASGNLRMHQLIEHYLDPKEHTEELTDFQYIVKEIVSQFRSIAKDYGQLEESEKTNGSGDKGGGYYLIGYRNVVYHISQNFAVTIPVEDYESIGSGQFHALGSLYSSAEESPRVKIENALFAAEFFNDGVRSPFRLYKQDDGTLEAI